ncbi:MAG: response regulator transcription factor [Bacteroidia bacterium]|nr:response regulator transcription factor [Bacteroidia bacterium]
MIRVLIADDHDVVRKGLKQIIAEEFHNADIHEAADGNELIKKVHAERFDIVISDISMPGRSGLESLKQLKEEYPKLPVLILSMHPEDQYALRVLKSGASGYLTKESVADELVKAVKQILGGRRYISVNVAEKLAESLDQNTDKELHENLSNREFDVLKLIASGKTVSEIAKVFSLSVNTISTYRARILEKMNFKNNAELTHYSIVKKLV